MTEQVESKPWIPAGWHALTPRLVVTEPAAYVRFLREAFGAEGEFAPDHPTIVRIEDSHVMVSEAGVREPTSSLLHLYVEDADATFARALRAGATSIEEPSDMPYGDRRAMVKDPRGNDWQIATPIDDDASKEG